MGKIKLIKDTKNRYKVYFLSHGDVIDESHGVDLGNFIRDVDGYFYYDPIVYGNGLWSSYSLGLIKNKLDEINKPYDDHLKEYFRIEQEKESNEK